MLPMKVYDNIINGCENNSWIISLCGYVCVTLTVETRRSENRAVWLKTNTRQCMNNHGSKEIFEPKKILYHNDFLGTNRSFQRLSLALDQ